MLTPQSLLPPGEVERLRNLRRLDIVPAVQEPVFNEFVRLTTLLFGVPISLISIVEADTVVYKANRGLSGLVSQPRVEAICSLAIREGSAIVLTDVTQEAQRLTPEAIAAAQVRNLQFYAGIPLPMPSQHYLGTLCVIDHQPRDFSPADWKLLKNVSELVTHTLLIQHTSQSLLYGERRWQIIQQLLHTEVMGISHLLQQLILENDSPLSASPVAIKRVNVRLSDLSMTLINYHQRIGT